jgi:hypothetical protein
MVVNILKPIQFLISTLKPPEGDLWGSKQAQNLSGTNKNPLYYDQVVCLDVTENAIIYVRFHVLSLKFVKFSL